MTETATRQGPPRRAARDGVDRADFQQDLERILVDVRAEAPARERRRSLLYDRVAELQAIGFGSLRLPVADGGGGHSLREFFQTLITVAAADSNLAHIFRGHIAFVESILIDSDESRRQRWLARFRSGELVGNASSERQETSDITTRLTADGDALVLDGTKYYTTGSIYADWIHLSAMKDDERVAVTVSAREPGVQSTDDWDGFGQQLTGSGTTVFDRVPVDPVEVERFGADQDFRSRYLVSVFQLCLLAVVAGIGEAALRDACEFVRPRTRVFGVAGRSLPREDDLVQGVVGDLASAAHAARSLVLASADELDGLLAARRSGAPTDDRAVAAQLNVYKAQQVVLQLVLRETAELFEVGGASAVGRKLALDRHWRNVRTIASHNPAIHRRRAIGDYLINGRAPQWFRQGRPAGDQDADRLRP